MLMKIEREHLVRYGKKLVEAGLTSGTGGNLSICDRQSGQIAITPSGIDYFETTAEDIVITDMEGNPIKGDNKPSSELSFHLAIYRKRPDISAIVHTHSTYATTIACLGMELPAVHYMIAFSGDKVPLAPYKTFGTPELAKSVADSIGDYNAVLLANHGLVACGDSIGKAFTAAEEIEFTARIYVQAKSIGKPVVLSDEEMKIVVDKFKTYGQKKR
jgi:L-fuculose-phosphate aldolase